MAKKYIKISYKKIFSSDDDVEFFVPAKSLPKVQQSSPHIVPALLGITAGAVAFLAQPFGAQEMGGQIVSSLGVAALTTLAIEVPSVTAVAAGYLGYEFAAAAMATLGQTIGVVAGAIIGGAVGCQASRNDSNDSAAMVIGAVIGGTIGYFGGRLGASVLTVGACFLGGAIVHSKTGLIGMGAAAAIGYFGATTVLERNIPSLQPATLHAPQTPAGSGMRVTSGSKALLALAF